jgi:cytochrome c-type biogenesis protein CcmH/NrfG
LTRTAPAGTAATAATTPGAPGSGAAGAPPEHDVNAMVARLAERLKKDGSDVNGWVQLVRSYRVLGEFDKAQAAMANARTALANDPDKLRQLAEGTAAAAPAASATPTASAAGAPGPSAADIAAAAQMKPDQQNEMIRSMVARLADRLKQDGSDVAGWERLLRAYMVLGDRDKAQAAVGDARRALAGDPDKLRRLDEVIRDLKVEG